MHITRLWVVQIRAAIDTIGAIMLGSHWLLMIVTLYWLLGLIWLLVSVVRSRRGPFGLFYGTVSRSMAPLFAFSTVILALATQPWLLMQEAHWLRSDPLIYGPIADRTRQEAQFTALETRDAQEWTRAIRRALDDMSPRNAPEIR